MRGEGGREGGGVGGEFRVCVQHSSLVPRPFRNVQYKCTREEGGGGERRVWGITIPSWAMEFNYKNSGHLPPVAVVWIN